MIPRTPGASPQRGERLRRVERRAGSRSPRRRRRDAVRSSGVGAAEGVAPPASVSRACSRCSDVQRRVVQVWSAQLAAAVCTDIAVGATERRQAGEAEQPATPRIKRRSGGAAARSKVANPLDKRIYRSCGIREHRNARREDHPHPTPLTAIGRWIREMSGFLRGRA